MGSCQLYIGQWNCMDDVIQFALTMNNNHRNAFLVVVSAVIWNIWNQRNRLCFRDSVVHTCQTVILNIISLISYWTGQMKEEVQAAANNWMPQDLDEVPLQVVRPEDAQMVEWISSDTS